VPESLTYPYSPSSYKLREEGVRKRVRTILQELPRRNRRRVMIDLM
jgi:hypothetical protein